MEAYELYPVVFYRNCKVEIVPDRWGFYTVRCWLDVEGPYLRPYLPPLDAVRRPQFPTKAAAWRWARKAIDRACVSPPSV